MTDATMLIDLPAAQPAHPARYTDVLLPVMASMLKGRRRILDPFGGTGKVFKLEHWLGAGVEIQAVELEPEYAAVNPRTVVGNALHLPWGDGYFDAICTSPTYGNRCADTLLDSYERITYTSRLGRKLHPDNSGGMQWGKKYKNFHCDFLLEAMRVLRGDFVLNMKDHYRDGELQEVTSWWIETMCMYGFQLVRIEKIDTPSNRYGANSDKRVGYESVILFTLEGGAA